MAIQRSNRSGGPKTAAGKLAVSSNALKTGSYSSRAVLPGESEEDFKQLQDQFVKDFLPKNVAESLIVHQLSSLTWKILRLQKLEDAHVLRALHQPIGESDLYRENLKLPYEYMSLIQDLSPYDDHFFMQNQTYLEYLRRFEDGYGISKDEFYEMPKIYPELYEDLVRMASLYTKTDKIIDVAPESLISLKYRTPEGGSIAFVHHAFGVLQKNCEDLVYIHQHLDHIRSAVTNIKEKRLLEALKDQGIMRAHDELQRSFYKALNELRRHQTWRSQTIDVNEEA
ncbi:MAG: hypothetical protein RLZ10_808 [Bacteroidota bacterium]|jgi:hypothetical protein